MTTSCSVIGLLALLLAGFASFMVVGNNTAQSQGGYSLTATAIQATNEWVSTALAQTATVKAYTATPTPTFTRSSNNAQSEGSFAMTATAIHATNEWVSTALAQTATAKAYTYTPSATPTP